MHLTTKTNHLDNIVYHFKIITAAFRQLPMQISDIIKRRMVFQCFSEIRYRMATACMQICTGSIYNALVFFNREYINFYDLTSVYLFPDISPREIFLLVKSDLRKLEEGPCHHIPPFGAGGNKCQCDFARKFCIWIIVGSMRHHFSCILKITLPFIR